MRPVRRHPRRRDAGNISARYGAGGLGSAFPGAEDQHFNISRCQVIMCMRMRMRVRALASVRVRVRVRVRVCLRMQPFLQHAMVEVV